MARKVFAWAAGGVLAVALLAVLALALLPALLPLERMTTESLAQRTGRPVTVDSISLSLLGGGRLEIEGLTIGELPRFGQRPLLKLQRLDARFSLLPLLADSLALDNVAVEGLELSLVRDKSGALNMRATPPDQQTASQAAAPPAEVSEAGRLTLGRLALNGAVLHLANLATGSSAQLPIQRASLVADLGKDSLTLDANLAMPGLEFVASWGNDGPAAPAGVKATLELAQLGQRLAVILPGLELDGRIDLALAVAGPPGRKAVSGSCRAAGLHLASPDMGRAPFDLADAELSFDLTVDWQRRAAQLQSLRLTSRDAGYALEMGGSLGPGQAQADFSQTVDLAKFGRVFAGLLPSGLTLAGQAEKKAELRGDDKTVRLSGFGRTRDLEVVMAGMAQPFRQKRAEVDFRLAADGQRNLVIDKLAVVADSADLNLSGKASAGGGHTAQLRLTGRLLDLDAVLPLTMALLTSEARPAGKPGGGAAPGGQGQAATGQSATARLRQSLSQGDVKLDLKLDRLIWSGQEARDVTGVVRLGGGRLTVERLTGRALDGSLSLNAGLDASGPRAVSSLNLTGKALRLDPKAHQRMKTEAPEVFLPLSLLNGVFDVQTQVRTYGLEADQMQRNANGKGGIQAPKGVSIDLDALGRLEGGQLLVPLLRQNLPRRFNSMHGSYTLVDGVMDYELIFANSPEKVDARVLGQTNLVSRAVRARLILGGPGLSDDLRAVLGPDGGFPLELGGTLDHPVAALNAKNVGGGLLRGLFGR